jgi:transposase-like protein
MSSHSVPLHCPYCAGENLHPHGDRHGAWECRECLRAFTVSFIGLLNPAAATQRGNAQILPSGGLQ